MNKRHRLILGQLNANDWMINNLGKTNKHLSGIYLETSANFTIGQYPKLKTAMFLSEIVLNQNNISIKKDFFPSS